METKNDGWGSRIGVVLAMAGNAVGFGNFLRFPIQAIDNGGGAFIIPYIVCFILLGLPLLFIEWTIGRFGGYSGNHSSPFIMSKMGKHKAWSFIGVFGIFSCIAIASYYCYMESWTISYVYHSILGTFQNKSQSEIVRFFVDYHNISSTHSGIPYENIVMFVLCLALNIWILSKGLKGGIEKVAKVGVPLLIGLGIFLAIRGVLIKPGEFGAIEAGVAGLNFLWTPQYTSLLDPKVWFAAAGQIFFTLSVGMGCIQCYASFLRKEDDIALGALTTGFLNEFIEIVLGGTIIICISIGFFGVEGITSMIKDQGGFGIAFQTLPFLFQKWGSFMGAICGVAFFGLLFIAGITSSLAMGTPFVNFLHDEFKLSRNKSCLVLGFTILICGLPTVIFFQKGVFDEYDYWAGTVSLFFFSMMQAILFSWVNGIDNSWKEFNQSADIKIPQFFKFVLKYITPTLLIIIFIATLIKPANDDWASLSFKGWKVDNNSIIGKIKGDNSNPNNTWFADTLFSEVNGIYKDIAQIDDNYYLNIACLNEKGEELGYTKSYLFKPSHTILISPKQTVSVGTPLMKGHFVNDCIYISMSRIFLVLIFLGLSVLVILAINKRKKNSQSHLS